ncbi:phosphatidylinositol 4-kinase alpha [Pelomyxa schiedti]|nr:phosphatidylinositol 4-kinase alpha [Pelomyxa schiedti]
MGMGTQGRECVGVGGGGGGGGGVFDDGFVGVYLGRFVSAIANASTNNGCGGTGPDSLIALSVLRDVRQHSHVLSLAHYLSHCVLDSPTTSNLLEPAFQILLRFLKSLSLCRSETSTRMEVFTYELICSAAHIAVHNPLAAVPISAVTASLCTEVLSNPNGSITRGLLRAFAAENFRFEDADFVVVIKLLESIISEDISIAGKLPLFEALSKLMHGSTHTYPDGMIDRLLSLALSTDARTVNSTGAMHLAASCAVKEDFARKLYLQFQTILTTDNKATSLTAVMEVLPILYERYPVTLSCVHEDMLKVVLSPKFLADTSRWNVAQSSFCKMLKFELEHNGMPFVRPVINTLVSKMYSLRQKRADIPGDVTKNNPEPPSFKDVITLLGLLTCHIDDPRVTELVVPTIISNTISYPPKEDDFLMLDQLTKIAQLKTSTVEGEVIKILGNLYHRTSKNIHCDPTIEDILAKISMLFQFLAERIKSVEGKKFMLRRMLVLIQQCAKLSALRPPGESIATLSPLKGIGLLLPVLASLTSAVDDETVIHPDSATQQLFRKVWFSCVLNRFTTEGEWRKDWLQSILRFAHKIPVLVFGKQHVYMEMNLELDGIIRGLGSQEIPVIRNNLLSAFGSMEIGGYTAASLLKGLTDINSAYILCVFHLEVNRPYNGNFQSLFSYLEDQSLEGSTVPNNNTLPLLFRAISDKVFDSLCNWFKAQPNTPARDNKLSSFGQFLLVNVCNRVLPASKAATAYVNAFVERFPQVLWQRPCIHTLLELVEAVNSRLKASPIELSHVRVPGTSFSVNLPEDSTAIAEMYREIQAIAANWITLGKKTSSEETVSALQEYLQSFTRSTATLPITHSGVALAIQLGTSTKELVTPNSTNENTAALMVDTIQAKAAHTGSINGMFNLLSVIYPDAGPAELQARLASILLQNLTKSCNSFGTPSWSFALYAGAMFEAATFVVTCDQYDLLLKKLVWAPVELFSVESMQVGVAVWGWLLAERVDLAIKIMSEISHAWFWTVDNHKGLFNQAPRPPSPLAAEPSASQFTGNEHAPHRVWIKFLRQRHAVIQTTSKPLLQILSKMMAKALNTPETWTLLPSSLGTRFQILLLAMQVFPSCVEESYLRQRIFACAFQWFENFPIWYEPSTREELVEDVKVLVDFCKLVAQDHTLLNSVLVKNKHALGATATIRASRALDAGTKSVSSLTIVPLISPLEEQLLQIYMVLKLQTRLVILLVGNEIERIIVWNNPLNRICLQIPEQNMFSSNSIPADLKGHWTDHVNTAWSVAPKLAVQLWIRFPLTHVKQLLSRKVMLNPRDVTACPEAVTLLVTEENVKNNIPELKYLVFWATTDPPTALSFLRGEYHSHPIVTQYAIRVLRKFNPETIIFYIPQLVQSLRYDKSDLVEDYLVEVASQSQIIAHQLIWNAQTYPLETTFGGGKVDTDFAIKAGHMRERIIQNFTQEEFNAYEEEFGFFGNFTAISGKLLPVEKDLRKPTLKAELRKLPVKEGKVYLPTNIHTVVHSIDPESAACLQSAEKVPILVNFMVSNKNDPSGTISKMGCIFKSGDDIRQDMLALQCIELLKRIFQSAGLKLFLFPYKIIATAPGCGVIEMVPNTMSRDQLGKNYAGNLYSYFLDKYGNKTSSTFQTARRNFIQSMAAYAIASYLLQVKDRHNGNILIDEQGHLIHIDFGFLFDHTPGGDMAFEKAPFKLTAEMIDIMGGVPTAEQFVWFMEQCVRAFLASRGSRNLSCGNEFYIVPLGVDGCDGIGECCGAFFLYLMRLDQPQIGSMLLQSWDSGYHAYVAMLVLDHAYNNPIANVFEELIFTSTPKTIPKAEHPPHTHNQHQQTTTTPQHSPIPSQPSTPRGTNDQQTITTTLTPATTTTTTTTSTTATTTQDTHIEPPPPLPQLPVLLSQAPGARGRNRNNRLQWAVLATLLVQTDTVLLREQQQLLVQEDRLDLAMVLTARKMLAKPKEVTAKEKDSNESKEEKEVVVSGL